MDKSTGTLLYSMVSRLKDPKRLAFLSDSIAQRKICSELQLAGKILLTCDHTWIIDSTSLYKAMHQSLEHYTSLYIIYSQKNLFVYFLVAALEYFKSHPEDSVNQKEFESTCGVGVVITPEQIENAVSK